MKKIISKILLAVAVIFFIYVVSLVSFIAYQRHKFMKECLQEDHTQEWCAQTLQELEALD